MHIMIQADRPVGIFIMALRKEHEMWGKVRVTEEGTHARENVAEVNVIPDIVDGNRSVFEAGAFIGNLGVNDLVQL